MSKKYNFFDEISEGTLDYDSIVPVSSQKKIPDGGVWHPEEYIDVLIPGGFVPIFFTFDKDIEIEDEDICLSYKSPGWFVCAKLVKEEEIRKKYSESHWHEIDWKGDFICFNKG